MRHKITSNPKIIRLPDGTLFAPADLLPAKTRHWVASRKMKLVLALHFGVISKSEACERYSIRDDELKSWQRAYLKHGKNGLKSTKIGCYR